ncbi:MAG: sugar phosphate isomerase/epimerase [Oscillospiraceae bacterium]|nr:sugar phosphate isomerase/epimerase [Oscillospiraceae bacterium]
MTKMKAGVQLYTLREHIKTYEDTDRTFAFLNDMGANVIQISGIGPIPPEKVAELVKKYNMDVCVTHTAFDRIADDTEAVMKEHEMIGCDCIGVGSMPDKYRSSVEGVREFIKITGKAGEKLAGRGFKFAYHNHNFEFIPLTGNTNVMDILLEETPPEWFWFTPDIAWMQIAGYEPAEYIKKMKNRVKVLHFKDYTDEDFSFTELGRGIVDLKACYDAAAGMGVPYGVYEQDSGFAENPLKSTGESFEFLSGLLKG